MTEPPPDPRCGTPYGYGIHVRERTPKCDACRRAHADYARDYYGRRYLNRGRAILVDATGSHRRLQALAAIGWSGSDLAAHLGVAQPAVSQWGRRSRLTPRTAARIAALYDELCWTPGPSSRIRAVARRKGWPPPLAWDDDTIDDPAARPHRDAAGPRTFDEIAVQRALHGDPVHLHPAERAEAVRRLTAAGHSAAEIADRLHVTTRTVVRRRERDSA